MPAMRGSKCLDVKKFLIGHSVYITICGIPTLLVEPLHPLSGSIVNMLVGDSDCSTEVAFKRLPINMRLDPHRVDLPVKTSKNFQPKIGMTQRAPADSPFSELAWTKVAPSEATMQISCKAHLIRAGGWARITSLGPRSALGSFPSAFRLLGPNVEPRVLTVQNVRRCQDLRSPC